ncbi:chemotaxis response regulator protein-glutamate methylesterase [Proteiniclasticum sp. C24MP]|uniref:protein-glutamate methylesterase/protein-glutamine glutaminase n=1 Tax=Proteiniclasticum sp. C24MP TaxID=3374101 RepID=UPI0037541B98
MQVRLMVVDDSAFMRKIISDAASEIEGVTVVGTARNGQDAIESIERYRPTVITMDIEMPKMNGIDALRIIKKNHPDIQVIMLSSHSVEGSAVTMEALEEGAFDFIEKSSDRGDISFITSQLETKLLTVNQIDGKPDKKDKNTAVRTERKEVMGTFDYRRTKAIVMGASTGGPKVLFQIVRALPRELDIPVFIVQHMPKGFTKSFADRLDSECPLRVVEAEEGMLIESGTVYVAPGDYHMIIHGGRITLNQNAKLHGVRPAVDFLFESASEKYGKDLLAILFTGMGKDGAEGMEKIKALGGYTLAQSKETCVVYGMPGYAVTKGVVDEVLKPEEITEEIRKIVKVKKWN